MAIGKAERVMNLAICLLMGRRYIEKSRIREVVEGYHGLSDAAFERTFERDKDDLRRMGVPLETGSNDPFFPDEIGYRIVRADFELPPIDFTPGEAAALGLASRVWESATQADQALSALAKLRAAGVDPEPSRLSVLAPSLDAREPAFSSIWAATMSHTPIEFSYRGVVRRLDPWAMTYRRGSWYLAGRDHDRDAPRVFKVARIDSPAREIGKPGSASVPDLDPDQLWQDLEPGNSDNEAVVAIRPGAAAELRRRGAPAQATPPPGYQAFVVGYARAKDFVAEICGFGADVIVLSPPEIRQAVITELGALVGDEP